MQVGTTKDQSLYNKPSAAEHPGALAARTVPQYNTIRSVIGCQIAVSWPLCVCVCVNRLLPVVQEKSG